VSIRCTIEVQVCADPTEGLVSTLVCRSWAPWPSPSPGLPGERTASRRPVESSIRREQVGKGTGRQEIAPAEPAVNARVGRGRNNGAAIARPSLTSECPGAGQEARDGPSQERRLNWGWLQHVSAGQRLVETALPDRVGVVLVEHGDLRGVPGEEARELSPLCIRALPHPEVRQVWRGGPREELPGVRP
jgi:hypothetical protein